MWFISYSFYDDNASKGFKRVPVILNTSIIYLIPLVNPDGREADDRYTDNGVDPNRNFNVFFGKLIRGRCFRLGKLFGRIKIPIIKLSPNDPSKWFRNCGRYPFSEPEVSSLSNFIKKLSTIDFRANFYETIMGTTDLSCLLSTSAAIIKEETDDANVIFFLRQADNFEIHTFDNAQANSLENQRIESCFSYELMTNICMSNKICTIDDMFAMGLQGNLIGLNTISAVTIPLGSTGSVQGFILIYR